MDVMDEFRVALRYQAVHGFPRMPDQSQGGASRAGPDWAASITPGEAARLRRAIDLGARGSFWYTERDDSLP